MPNLTCEDFGLKKEEMAERLIKEMANRLLEDGEEFEEEDEDGYAYRRRDTVFEALNKKIQDTIHAEVYALFDKEILPKVDDMLKNLMVPHTNRYGEKKEPDQTLLEYVARVADNYLNEQVDHNGKTQAQESYSWRASSTRLMYAVNEHLQYTLSSLVKEQASTIQGEFATQVMEATKRAVHNLKLSTKTEVRS